MNRTVTIVPGSSSWWLVTLSPLLFYDTIRVCSADLDAVLQEGSQSSFHDRVAMTLDALLNSEEHSIIVQDKQLPAFGRSPELYDEAKRLAAEIISYSGEYTPSRPTLISPAHLKKSMRVAYTTWIEYNMQKFNSLHKTESFANVLRTSQIPQSQNNLRRIIHTPPNRFPDLLEKDLSLRKVFEELVRNAILITSLAKDPHSRAYDTLIEEFVPTIELVERVKVFCELPDYQQESQDFTLLSKFYDFRIKKVTRTSKEIPNAIEAVRLALKGRHQFSVLRKKIAELDTVIQQRSSDSAPFFEEIASMISDINRALRRIDEVGGWGIWLSAASSAYFFAEMIASSSPELHLLLKSLVFNPYTTKRVKEALQNFTLVRGGLKPNWSGRISLIRDFATPRLSASLASLYQKIPVQAFKFWV